MLEPLLLKCCLQRQREIEAVNGAWAMIGLTAGLVIEGHTGNSILAQVISLTERKKGSFSIITKKHTFHLSFLIFLLQLAGYWAALLGFFLR